MRRTTQVAVASSILAVAARLIWIDQPYVDNWSWRQSDVAAIARNYFQGGFHFTRPQIDWAGDQSGYVGTEFPVLPFLAAVCYRLFGVHEWIGRIQAVVLFTLSLPFFFLFVRKLLGEIAAIWALFFYSFAPLGVMASRCFIPDTPSLAFSLIGLYCFHRWNENQRWTSLLAGAVCISLSILIKATSALIGAPLACLAFQRFRFSAFRSFQLWIFGAIALLPSTAWYWHAYKISEQFYPHHFFGAGGFEIMNVSWYWDIAREAVTSALTPFLFLTALFGALIAKSKARVFYWWLAAMIVFIIVVGYGNRHPWYRLPLVPIAAVFGGIGCASVAATISGGVKVGLSILLAACFSISGLVYIVGFCQPTAANLREAGLELKQLTPPGALIVAADNGDPTVFYYAERKGWHLPEKNGIYNGEPLDVAQAIADVQKLQARGGGYLVLTSNTFWWLYYYPDLAQYLGLTATLVQATPQFKIYKLNRPTE